MARLELPVPHDVAWDGDAERAAFPPEAYGEAGDESRALGTPELGQRWGVAHARKIASAARGGLIVVLPAKSDFVRL
jgi:hypothetical protein